MNSLKAGKQWIRWHSQCRLHGLVLCMCSELPGSLCVQLSAELSSSPMSHSLETPLCAGGSKCDLVSHKEIENNLLGLLCARNITALMKVPMLYSQSLFCCCHNLTLSNSEIRPFRTWCFYHWNQQPGCCCSLAGRENCSSS